MFEGVILAIDPSPSHLGWSVSSVDGQHEEPFVLIDYGTIYSRGKGTELLVYLVEEISAIIVKHRPSILAIEDFFFNPRFRQGCFAIPGVITLLKYHWFTNTGKEAVVVSPQTWKSIVCGNGNANKDEVRENMKRFLPPEVIEHITERFAALRGERKSDMGEQDCYDAIAIGLYICWLIGRNREIRNMNLKFRKEDA